MEDSTYLVLIDPPKKQKIINLTRSFYAIVTITITV